MDAESSRIAMVTSVSAGTPWAEVTTPNHAEYCLLHGYTFIARALPYDQAVRDFQFLDDLLSIFDIVWCLDSDAVVTDMTKRVQDLPLRRGMNVCRENISTPDPWINCGSVIWARDDPGWSSAREARAVIGAIREHESGWSSMQWIWQQWVEGLLRSGPEKPADHLCRLGDAITVHPPRLFNSCDHGEARNWQPGDFVYHPCGEPAARRLELVRAAMMQVRR